ncbi:membrane-bound lytic murein transglycosylase MltF [Avibacterium gallinarum]|uniref:Membrane-bound lytic murein transglycosylase F n=1 Tax=Avibacterium gallinarum TaxID=755 RepID=A0A379AZR8_AVIGA|nr:membrane-bound lytic murein transglycosylase MltF [Avibacterium gallinarum]POY44050.1 membrane-bound lytic murein transglycosylase MltF [Avibacterium gallinarum]TDP29147.1 membrane-bound lytic murein transglycosylase F [Avibacterium gallinarum]SUB28415.1 membrane-bound lytic murein transglycosylase F [Avibacterium gallinarum]
MKGLFLRIVSAVALLLWAIDMVFPWQRIMQSEDNPYAMVQTKGKLIVGTLNNPISYFIGSEGATGFEYELTKAFADYLNVELDIRPMDSVQALFSALSAHQIDLAAANLLYQPEKLEQFQLGPAYSSASWQLVYRKGENRPNSLARLNGRLVVAKGSELNILLNRFKEQYPDLQWTTVDQSQEELLLQVAESKIDYTIANSIDISITQQIKPQLAVAFDVTDEATIHWYLANNTYNELQAALLDFMNNAIETGLIARIEEKYFNHLAQFDYVDTRSYLNAIETILPKYADLFDKYKGDLDWRLLAAIAYQESHWNPEATSPTGVRGMMMLTKATAERMKINNRLDAEQSIKAGAEYLHLLLAQMPNTIRQEDRIWFALCAYNMGLGHLLDVRRLTKSLGGDPDNWLDVKKNLPLLAEKRYYTNLKYGYARGYEAFQYVENIRRYMNSIVNYHRVQQNQEEQNQPLPQHSK